MSTRLTFTRGTLASAPPDAPLTFTASAEGVNRYGFSLNSRRWKIDNFNGNPVILWMHMDYTPPIGRGRASLASRALRTDVTFDRADPFAMQIENKYRSGFLNAVSVGFDFVDDKGAPVSRWDLTAEAIYNEVFYDLAEVSAVPVPADPQALVRQRHALAMDFGFRPDEETEEWLAAMGSMRPRAPQPYVTNSWDPYRFAGGPAMPMMPSIPTLPGNSEMEQRLSRIERMVERLSASREPEPAPVDDPDDKPDEPEDPPVDDPETTEQDEVDESLASDLLSSLTLARAQD